MRILIADDHEAVRKAIRSVLSASPDCDLIAEAAAGDEAVRLAILHRPDVAVLDIRMPVLNGISAASRIVELSPGTAVLMSSLSRDWQHIAAALAAGAYGYIGKDEAGEHLITALMAVASRHYYWSPSVAASMHAYAASPAFAGFKRDVLALYDRYAVALFRCAKLAGADDQLAGEALLQTFLAYQLARAGAQQFTNLPVWLFASIAAFAFARCSLPGATGRRLQARPLVTSLVSTIRCSYKARLQPHPTMSAFVSYWSGRLGASARQQIVEHVSGCPLCHLEWCLAASVQESTGPDRGEEYCIEQRTRAARAKLENELLECDLGSLAESLREHNKASNALLVSEIDMFFGAAAATTRFESAGPRRAPGAALINAFLGARTSSIAASLRNRLTPA